ncbi:hypothetical protein [Dokdonia sp.]|uniref:hypothetical protein n=1 Tax=Dokdonia sp. TaxID=2024995 RepID=UPI003265B49C
MLSFSFTTNNEKEETYRPIQELNSDSRFIGLLQDQLQLVNNAKDLKTLASYDSKENLSNADINKISTLLGYKSRAAYESAVKSKVTVIKALEKDYNLSKYSKEQLTQISLTTMNSRSFKAVMPTIIDGDTGGDTSECERLCENSRIACIAAAAAAATAGHVACLAADTTIILGIACHAAVAATQAAVSHQCNTTAAQCVHACRN